MVDAEVQRGLFEVCILGRACQLLKEQVEKEELVFLRCVLSCAATEDCRERNQVGRKDQFYFVNCKFGMLLEMQF